MTILHNDHQRWTSACTENSAGQALRPLNKRIDRNASDEPVRASNVFNLNMFLCEGFLMYPQSSLCAVQALSCVGQAVQLSDTPTDYFFPSCGFSEATAFMVVLVPQHRSLARGWHGWKWQDLYSMNHVACCWFTGFNDELTVQGFKDSFITMQAGLADRNNMFISSNIKSIEFFWFC